MKESLSNTIVDKAVDAELQKGKTNVEAVTSGVEKKVAETTKQLQAEYGDDVKDLCDEAMKEAKGYGASRKEILQGFDVEDLSPKDAAGICDKTNNRVAIDRTYLERGENEAAEKKTLDAAEAIGKHETRHTEQAASFDTSEITINGTVIRDIDLYEGDAMHAEGDSPFAHTTEYTKHKELHDVAVAATDKETVERAIESGKLHDIELALAA